MMPSWKTTLALAHAEAQAAEFEGMLSNCMRLANEYGDDAEVLMEVGSLLLNFGYLALAAQQFDRVAQLKPQDFRTVLNLANVAQNAGQHATAQQLYMQLLKAHPNSPVVRRNLLATLQYNPDVSDHALLLEAQYWGQWATQQAGGPKARPAMKGLTSVVNALPRPLRVGYVSADFCQHTVGLFIMKVIEAHRQFLNESLSSSRVEVFAYSSGRVSDWVTKDIQLNCTFKDVSTLSDASLAQLIQEDQIDVLVDLSGHTAGSRLTAFAYRPAPVQVSWLGYYATTGLDCIDAVVLDKWHAPQGTESQFTESIVRLEAGRFNFQPVPWAPNVSDLPSASNGFMTFGCFNNTSKFNVAVFEVWANVLHAVPQSKLILKWRTLADDALCQSIYKAFSDKGIDLLRIELRSASFHADLLHQYADIDIALDPFPFTGGLTSCEALWMGVPVITWPQSRVVSRQTFALLSTIGMADWAAKNAEDYVNIAKTMASDTLKLAELRANLRKKMQASPLMDTKAFTRQLEASYFDLHQKILGSEQN